MATEKLHSELGASSAERWMNCPGSVRLSRGMLDSSSIYSREGTAAHTLAERCLHTSIPPEGYLGVTFDGVEVTEEMVEAVQVFVDTVVRICKIEPAESEMSSERHFDLASLNPPGAMWGTADAVVWLPQSRKLCVLDFKYGQGVAVEAKANPQLRYYALGAMLSLPLGRVPHEITTTIVQPRASHPDGIIRSDTFTFHELFNFTEDLLSAARRTLEPDAPLTPGSWCRFCRAAPICPALAAQATAVAQVEFTVPGPILPPDPSTLPKEVLLRVVDNADLLDNWLRSVRGYVIAKIKEDETYAEGRYKLVEKRAVRRWIDPDNALIFARDRQVPEDQIFDKKLRSPAQMERWLTRQEEKDMQALVHKQSSGVTLAPAADSRPAVNTSAGSAFAVLPPARSDD